MIKLFISHSAHDAALAKAIAELLGHALDLESSNIRCTSVTPYNLLSGANTDATLRREIKRAKLVIGLLTEDSTESYYVLAELGARWVVDKPFMIFRSSNFAFKSFGGPLANLMISPIDTAQIWMMHLNQAANIFGRGRINRTNAINGYISEALKQDGLLKTGLLKVHSAKWGSTVSHVDITNRVAGLVLNDCLSVFAGNDLAAHDPALNVPKELEIEFTYNGRKQKLKWAEGVHCHIP